MTLHHFVKQMRALRSILIAVFVHISAEYGD